MIKKFRLAIIAALLPVLFFSACGQKDTALADLQAMANATPTPSAAGADTSANAADATSAPDYTYKTDNMLDIYMPWADTNAGMNYMSSVAQQNGFNIVFRSGPPQQNSVTDETAFMNGNPGGVYIMTMDFAGQLYNSGYIGDFGDQAGKYAPDYLTQWSAENPEGGFYFMPTSDQYFAIRPCALTKTDLYNQYGKDIKTGSDYENLLNWLKGQSSSAPCLACVDSENSFSIYGFLPIDVFLPEAGYTSLSTMFADTNGVFGFLWMNDADGTVKPFYDIPEAADALTRFIGWKQERLADFYFSSYDNNGKLIGFKGSDYDTVLTTTGDVQNIFSDMQGYTLSIFDEPQLAVPGAQYVAVAAPGTDVSEFLKFMEWMPSSIDNYNLFSWGNSSDQDHYDWEVSQVFNHNSMNLTGDDFSSYNIPGYTADTFNLPAAALPLDWQTRFNIGTQLQAEKVMGKNYEARFDYIYNYMLNYLTTLSGMAGTTDSAGIRGSIVSDFQNLDGIKSQDLAAQLVNEALGNK